VTIAVLFYTVSIFLLNKKQKDFANTRSRTMAEMEGTWSKELEEISSLLLDRVKDKV
jgi:hypothetical protein